MIFNSSELTLIHLFMCQAGRPCVKLSPIFERSEDEFESSRPIFEGELDSSRLTSEDEKKLPTLADQALEIKQALLQLAKIASDQVAPFQAQNTIKSLQEERFDD